MSAPASFFEKRGVSTGVWKARPYIRYEQGDPERVVREAWAHSPSFAAKIANQCNGLIIPRFAPTGMRLLPVPAELRPNAKVKTGSHWHYHGAKRPREELIIETTGNRLPKRWIHPPDAPWVAEHVKDVHGEVNPQDVHLDENWAKYVFPPGRGAKRLDVHPDAWTKFSNASRVFFVIEGCIKADAVLSAGEAVFSVPSVTLWQAPELSEFAKRYLTGRECIIIPDADWYTNKLVEDQAKFCFSFLRRLGVNAKVAAPPIGGEKGVDDHLGSGGKMSELVVLDHKRACLRKWLVNEDGSWRVDRYARNEEVMDGLSLHAGRGGTLKVSFRHLARIMGVGRRRFTEAIKDLEECGAITVEGSLEAGPVYKDKGYDWIEEPPTIIIHPQLRSKPEMYPLG